MKKFANVMLISAIVSLMLGFVVPVRAEMPAPYVLQIPDGNMDEITFVHITDTHITDSNIGYSQKLINILKEVNETKYIAFIVFTGDEVTCSSDPEKNRRKMEKFNEIVATYTNIYSRKVKGNHDRDLSGSFEKIIDDFAWMFYAGNYACIAFDGLNLDRNKLVEQSEKATQDGKKIFLFNHYPLDSGMEVRMDSEDSAFIKELCETYSVLAVFWGHTHVYSVEMYLLPGYTVPISCLPDCLLPNYVWGICGGVAKSGWYSIVRVKGCDVDVEFKKASPGKHLKPKIVKFDNRK